MTVLTRKHLSRRTVLRGAGASLALPLLDAMVPAHAAAASPVRRFGAVYVPMGASMALWTPGKAGLLELSPILQVLAPFKHQLLVITGLDMAPALPIPDEGGGQHSRAQATWLTGARAKKTEGQGLAVGTSLDQIIAREYGQATQLPSLEIALEAIDTVGACEVGYSCAYSGTIAWRTPATPLPMEIDPRMVFEQLFGDTGSTDPRAREARARRDSSILDSLSETAHRLTQRLGPTDRVKLTAYLDAVRDIEQRIQKAEDHGSRELPVVEQPAGLPASHEAYARVMFDLLALAWQTDLTRVSTFMVAREMSLRTYPDAGITEPHHPLSHHQNDPEKLAMQAKLNVYHLKLFAHFLQTLASTPDGDGSLLDHSILLYGSSMSDSNNHVCRNVPTLVLGGGGGRLTGDRHLVFPAETPLANLQLTLIDKMGVRAERFGDSTGELSGL